ncbi:hypothetical protein DL93DRAFT_1413094 [Clavulina sp. PMI_390]|nr:hypothetical protein DL93DRAFT_1413094 [Clavulina sp. PMI_390]
MSEPVCTHSDPDLQKIEESAKTPLRDMLAICGIPRCDILQMCIHKRWRLLRKHLSEIDDANSKSKNLLIRARCLLEFGALKLLSHLVIDLAQIPLSPDSSWCFAVWCLHSVANWSRRLPLPRPNTAYPPRDWSVVATPLLTSLGRSQLFDVTRDLPECEPEEEECLVAVRMQAAGLIELLSCDLLHHSDTLPDAGSIIPFAQVTAPILVRLRIVLLKYEVFDVQSSSFSHCADLLSRCLCELLKNPKAKAKVHVDDDVARQAVQLSLRRLGELDGRPNDQLGELSVIEATWQIGNNRSSLTSAFDQHDGFVVTAAPLCSGACLPHHPRPEPHPHDSDTFEYYYKLMSLWYDVIKDDFSACVKVAEKVVAAGIIFRLEWFDAHFDTQLMQPSIRNLVELYRRAFLLRIIEILQRSTSVQLHQQLLDQLSSIHRRVTTSQFASSDFIGLVRDAFDVATSSFPSLQPQRQTCHAPACDHTEPASLRCSACHELYCCKECQRRDWKWHKKTCRQPRKSS